MATAVEEHAEVGRLDAQRVTGFVAFELLDVDEEHGHALELREFAERALDDPDIGQRFREWLREQR